MSTTYEPGAAPAGFIPLCIPVIQGNEWDYVKNCLDTGWVSSVGSYVDQFEQQVAQTAGTPYAVATVNGTAALHIALLVAGVEPDDEVLISTLTFIAPANAIRYCGAHPVFVDAEPDYWQMDVQRVADFLRDGCTFANGEVRNNTTGRRVKAILPVDILGHPVDMQPLLDFAEQYHLVIVEDSTETLGAKYHNQPVGSLSHIACFSFNGNKIITTGGGGMIVTHNETWAKRAKYLTTQAKDDPLEYMHGEVGYNYRLTNIQAALGCAQMEMLPDYLAAKRRIAATYNEAFANIPGITPLPQAPYAASACWMYTLLIDETITGVGSRELLRLLHDQSIQTRPLWQPLHLSKAFPDAQVLGGDVAERLNQQALSLPCSVNLSSDQQETVIEAVLQHIRHAAIPQVGD